MSEVLRKYPSDSNPGTYHNVTRGKDGVVYCTCWAWKRNRWCKHLIHYFQDEEAKEAQYESRVLTEKNV
jgi:hypothetical protein